MKKTMTTTGLHVPGLEQAYTEFGGVNMSASAQPSNIYNNKTNSDLTLEIDAE